MKKLAIASLVALALLAVGAAAARSLAPARPPLPARVAALELKVRRLGVRLRADEGKLGCLRWVGLSSYGDTDNGNGYLYTPDAGASTFVTSALDFAEQDGAPPSIYSVEILRECAVGTKAAHAAGRRAIPQMPPLGEKLRRWGVRP